MADRIQQKDTAFFYTVSEWIKNEGYDTEKLNNAIKMTTKTITPLQNLIHTYLNDSHTDVKPAFENISGYILILHDCLTAIKDYPETIWKSKFNGTEYVFG